MKENQKSIDDTIPLTYWLNGNFSALVLSKEPTFIDLFLLLKAYYEKLPIIYANIRL